MAENNLKLFLEAMAKFLLGIVLTGILVFLPAGTIFFARGWLLMGILFVPMFIAGLVMMVKNPELLKKRLNAKEKDNKQKIVVALSGLVFLLGFIIAGLTFRFNLYTLPVGVTITSTVVFLLGYILYAEVLRENSYLSRTIEIQENQKVISVGLYGLVRHPMYSATVLMFLTIPLILGSVYAFLVFMIYPVIIAVRIKGEERFLEENLEGYREYKQKIRYRLLPFVW